MKKWLIYDYENSQKRYKMFKRVIKSNNLAENRKEENRRFVLKELKLDHLDTNRTCGLIGSRKESLMSSGLRQ